MPQSTSTDRIKRCLAAHPDWTNRQVARSTHTTSGQVAALRGNQPATAPANRRGRTLAEFRDQFDKSTIVPKRIKTALAELGRSHWLYELEFQKLAGVSLADLGNFRDQFSDYVVAMRTKRAWAGSTELAAQMREALT